MEETVVACKPLGHCAAAYLQKGCMLHENITSSDARGARSAISAPCVQWYSSTAVAACALKGTLITTYVAPLTATLMTLVRLGGGGGSGDGKDH